MTDEEKRKLVAYIKVRCSRLIRSGTDIVYLDNILSAVSVLLKTNPDTVAIREIIADLYKIDVYDADY